MAIQTVRNTGNFAGLPPVIQQQYRSDPGLQLAQALQQSGADTSHVGSSAQGLARLLQGALSSIAAVGTDQKYQEAGKKYNDTIAQALTAQPREAQPQEVGPEPTKMQRMAEILSGNPNTAPLGLQLKMQGIEDEQKQARELAIAEAKAGREPPKTRTVKRDGNEITEEFNPKTRTWTEIASSPQFKPEGDKPLSSVGQLAADYKAGRIDERTYKAALAKATKMEGGEGGSPFGNSMDARAWGILLSGNPSSPEYAAAHAIVSAPKMQAVPDPNNPGQMIMAMVTPQLPPQIRPPGGAPAPTPGTSAPGAAMAGTPAPTGGATVTPIPGTERPDAANQAALKKLDTMRKNLASYRAALEDYGTSPLSSVGAPPTGATELTSKAEALRLDLKNLYELGALVGGDFQILDRLLTDPGSAKGVIKGKEGLLAQLDQLENQLNLKIAEKKPSKPGAAAASTPAVNNPYANMTDDEIRAKLKEQGIIKPQ